MKKKKLDRTKALIQGDIDRANPVISLVHVLEAALELVSLEGNDFTWSSWDDSEEAVAEINALLDSVKNNRLPDRSGVAILFAMTGPLEEVGLSSGWGDLILEVAKKYKAVEHLIW